MAIRKADWKQKLSLTIASCLVLATVLGVAELYCRYFTRINFLDNSRGLFTFKRFGESYGNAPNFEGISFGEVFYIDENGFRVDPTFTSKAAENAEALLIMGDSVSFGPALKDNVTIAGILRRSMPETKIYNGSVIGYDSFDYKTVTLALVERHPEINSVVLFLCLNDINDASSQLIRSQAGPVEETRTESPSIPRIINDYLRSRSKLFLWLKNLLFDTQMFWFKADLANYQKGQENVRRSLQPILELERALNARDITFKVFVSPYEAQFRSAPPEDHHLPQRMISSILLEQGIEVHDLTPGFGAYGNRASELFLYGDPMHVSAEGAKVAAEIACSKLPGCKLQQ